MHLVLPKGHPAAKRRAVRLEELAGDSWLGGVRGGRCHEMVIRACNRAGFDPEVAFESDDAQVLQGLVAAGLGVTILPELGLQGARPDVEIRPIVPEPPVRQVWAVTPASGYRSPATTAMIEVLQEVSAASGHALKASAAK
jgi:DNA-binding transcriptional LysR family regulator